MLLDYLIVGAGLAGATCARILSEKGYSCEIIEKRQRIGGNCHDYMDRGIMVHSHGPHIFHTSDEEVWKFVNRFAEFNDFKYKVVVNHEDELYSFPINLLTLHQLWGVKSISDAKTELREKKGYVREPSNMEEWLLSNYGKDIYERFFLEYTYKQWGMHPRELPVEIAKRIPFRFTFDDNYFTDKYQGLPIGGYTNLIQEIIGDVRVNLDYDYFSDDLSLMSKRIIYTGPIDKFFNYKYGALPYRSLKFETELHKKEDYQGVAAINYTSIKEPYTRIIEHKYWYNSKTPHTIITKEYPRGFGEPYYPIGLEENKSIYNKYLELKEDNITFAGRLAEYKYYNMDQIIKRCHDLFSKLPNK